MMGKSTSVNLKVLISRVTILRTSSETGIPFPSQEHELSIHEGGTVLGTHTCSLILADYHNSLCNSSPLLTQSMFFLPPNYGQGTSNTYRDSLLCKAFSEGEGEAWSWETDRGMKNDFKEQCWERALLIALRSRAAASTSSLRENTAAELREVTELNFNDTVILGVEA